MNVAVVIPWREQPSRRYARQLVAAWYAQYLPNADMIYADTDDPVFNLAGARNRGVRIAEAVNADVVVINDADTLPDVVPLSAAIEDCTGSGLVHLPYTEYRSLSVPGTQDYLRGVELYNCQCIIVPGAVSGVMVTTPDTWWTHNGQDENFRGWGFEDAAWAMAHETLLGKPPFRHEGAVFALHHDSAVKEGAQYEANAARCYKYECAVGDVDRMWALVTGAE